MAERTLYSYWRSQASYRVRIALALKGLRAKIVTLDLLKGDQFASSYRALNPEASVPALVEGADPPLIQSLAILEYLEECHPEPPLLPKETRARAHARALGQVAAMDAHPLIVPRVRHYLTQELGIGETALRTWIRHWLEESTRTLETLLARDPLTGRFCVGDAPTFADLCVVPHIATARMLYGADLVPYPTLARIHAACMALPAFAETAPEHQPDAPRS
ncbi:MAG TPA: maleylacetoacetate isomerase [Acetobacteraceae bacterium]|nr:maleylacetoacetate isomerase [Acetobacteraceae bacterium]